MRYKKQIIIICLFTFLFLPFQKYEQPKAEILTLTSGVIIACAALATATGVVITNPDMLEDIGTRVYEGIKNIDGAMEQVGDKVKINVIDSVLKAVIGVVTSLPKEDYYFDKTFSEKIDCVDGTSEFVGSFDITGFKDKEFFANVTSPDGTKSEFQLYFMQGSNNGFAYITSTTTSSTMKLVVSHNKPLSGYAKGLIYVNGNSDYSYSRSVVCNTTNWTLTVRCIGTGSLTLDYDKSICIPYTEKNTENVSEDKPKVYFPTGTGSISAPLNKPLSDYNPSVDSPLSLPSDLVGSDGISADVDTDIGDDVIDIPNTDVGDTPVTGESLWDTLLEWLRTLIQPIIDLLTAILGFFSGLLDKLRELLIELFVPSDGIFVDTFNGWKSDLEGKFGLDLSVIDGLQSVEEQGVKDIEFTVMGVDVVLPLSFVNQFASTSRTFTTGLVIIFLVWYQYRNAYKLIRNSSPIEGDGGGKK